MEPLGFELGQASCFDRSCSCEGREKGVQIQAGLGHSAEDAGADGDAREQEPALEGSMVGPQQGSGCCGVRGTQGTSS